MSAFEVTLLPSTAVALNNLTCEVGTINVDLPAMAWLWFVARELPDSPERFPHGKWATLQSMERQLVESARKCATPWSWMQRFGAAKPTP